MIQSNADIMEAMEGLEDVIEDQLSVKSIAKLSDSEMVLKFVTIVATYTLYI